jgi:hypothetical protein
MRICSKALFDIPEESRRRHRPSDGDTPRPNDGNGDDFRCRKRGELEKLAVPFSSAAVHVATLHMNHAIRRQVPEKAPLLASGASNDMNRTLDLMTPPPIRSLHGNATGRHGLVSLVVSLVSDASKGFFRDSLPVIDAHFNNPCN